jgi:hypothetical protein
LTHPQLSAGRRGHGHHLGHRPVRDVRRQRRRP